MRKHLSLVTILLSVLVLAGGSLAQSDPRIAAESSFEVTLSVVTGSNDSSQKGELPAALSSVAKQLRSTFGFTNLRLGDTYVGRIGNNGTIAYKSIANIDGNSQSSTPSFLDWQITGLRNAANGANSVFINSFRFGARVPVIVGQSANNAPIQYENVGLTVDRMTATINSPVLIGTVALPKADGGRVFLVLNVSPVIN
jgi:hypothetical protein